MKIFACKHCTYTVETIGTEAWHECVRAGGRKHLVKLELVPDKIKASV